jgi:hypothetical protein
VHGEQRVAGWLDGPIEAALSCPRGHHIRDGALALDNQVFRCVHRDRQGATPCGLLVWIVFDRGRGVVYAAEVDWDDVRAMQELRTAPEQLRFLGVPMWPRHASPHRTPRSSAPG